MSLDPVYDLACISLFRYVVVGVDAQVVYKDVVPVLNFSCILGDDFFAEIRIIGLGRRFYVRNYEKI